MEKKVASKEREGKEEKLRELARVARDKRVGIHGASGEGGEGGEEGEEGEGSTEAARERDVLRQERHKERERERRLARAHPEKRLVMCKTVKILTCGVFDLWFCIVCYYCVYLSTPCCCVCMKE